MRDQYWEDEHVGYGPEAVGRRYSHPDSQENIWAMALHLSVFASYLIPLAGMIVPIVIWQVKKDVYPSIDEHGRVVVNGLISFFLFVLISIPLVFVLIGIPMLAILAVLGIAFPIIGGIKATNGEVWRYPLTVNFV